jgi:hypothetical protein
MSTVDNYLIFINSISHLSCIFITILPNAGDFPFFPRPLWKFILPLGINILPPPTELWNLKVVRNSIGNKIYISLCAS